MIPLAAPLGRLVLTAAASAGLVKAVGDGRGTAALRRVAVTGTKLGIRASRVAETGVERSRLGLGDVVAQAYDELGERVPVREAPAAGHDHQH